MCQDGAALVAYSCISGTAVKIDKQFHRYTVLRSHGEAVSALRLCASWSSIASGPTYELDKRFSWMMTKDETILRSEKLKNVFIFIYTLQFDTRPAGS